MSEENRKLREDFLPILKEWKDKSQPLPNPDEAQSKNGGVTRTQSMKRLYFGGNGPKNPSPTTIQERILDGSSLDPSAAAMAASSHLGAGIRDGSLGSPGHPQPSPTSPGYRDISAPSSTGPTSRPFPRTNDSFEGLYSNSSTPAPTIPTPGSGGTQGSFPITSITTPPTATPPNASTTPNPSGSTPQVEIFKSFRVSIDDPCHKVLPVALKKYNITADWRQYALYIVYGDQERCLGLNERPLILFKQLDKEGRKPMFMLRKHAAPAEGHISSVGGGPPQPTSSGGSLGSLPGGVL